MLQQDINSLPGHYMLTPVATGVVLTATGDKVAFPIPYRCTLLYAALAMITTCAGGDATPVVKFDHRPTAGSDASRGDGDCGVFVLGTQAGGKMVYFKPTDRVTFEPGEEVIMEVTTAAAGGGAAGACRPVLVVRVHEEMPGNLSGMVAATAA